MPEWSLQSDELFYVSGDTLMVTEVTTGPTFSNTTPQALFVSADFASNELWYGVSPDGQRFLYPAANPQAPAREIHIVVNWFEELRSR
jgi:Tol biopolymer transport system component